MMMRTYWKYPKIVRIILHLLEIIYHKLIHYNNNKAKDTISYLANQIDRAEILDIDLQYYYDNWYRIRTTEKITHSVFSRIKTAMKLENIDCNMLLELCANQEIDDAKTSELLTKRSIIEFYYLHHNFDNVAPLHLDCYKKDKLMITVYTNETLNLVARYYSMNYLHSGYENVRELLTCLELIGIDNIIVRETNSSSTNLEKALLWLTENCIYMEPVVPLPQ